MKRRREMTRRILACLVTATLVLMPFQAPVFAEDLHQSDVFAQEVSDLPATDAGVSSQVAEPSYDGQQQEAEETAAEDLQDESTNESEDSEDQAPADTEEADQAAEDADVDATTENQDEVADDQAPEEAIDTEIGAEADDETQVAEAEDAPEGETPEAAPTADEVEAASATQPSEEAVASDSADPAAQAEAPKAFPLFLQQQATVDGITVKVLAPEGAFPEDATLFVDGATPSQRERLLAAVDEQRGDDQNVARAYTFNIKVLDADGNELQPANGKPVSVSFTLNEVADANLDTQVYHMAQYGDSLEAEPLVAKESGDVVTVKTSGFSFYTVEFTYGSMQYEMPGDSTIPLSTILGAVGLSGNPTEVTCSNEGLFSASNAGGEWVVTAHQAFASTEWMRVVIDGIPYDITVTDDVASGVFRNVPWNISDTGKMTIGVEGEEYTYASSGVLNADGYPWYAYRTQVTSVEFAGTVHGNGFHGNMFNGFTNLVMADFTNFDGSAVTNYAQLFSSCTSLTTVNADYLVGPNVASTGSMFANCQNLETLRMDYWDTSGIITMTTMFWNCKKLQGLELGGWDTSNVMDMTRMFDSCSSLRWLGLSSFDMSGVAVAQRNAMLDGLSSLRNLSLGEGVRLEGTGFDSAFYWTSNWINSYSAADLITNFDADPTNMAGVYYACLTVWFSPGAGTGEFVAQMLEVNATGIVLPTTPLTGFEGPAGQKMLYRWDDTSTQYVPGEEVAVPNGTVFTAIWANIGNFRGVDWLITPSTDPQPNQLQIGNQDHATEQEFLPITSSLDASDWPWYASRGSIDSVVFVAPVKGNGHHKSMFEGCGMQTADLTAFNTTAVTDIGYMFKGCSNLASLDVSGWDTSNVTNMADLFDGCASLSTLDMSGWDTSSVTDMVAMFQYCSSLASLDLSSWDTGNVTDMTNMFAWCANLGSVNMDSWDTANVKDMNSMFWSCSNLTSVNGISDFDTHNVQTFDSMFGDCSKLTSLDLSLWNTGKAMDMTRVFSGCSELASLNISGWVANNVTSFYEMFLNCSKLKEIDVSSFETENAIYLTNMFRGCSSLEKLDLSLFKIAPDSSGMLAGLDSLKELKLGPSFELVSTNFSSSYVNWTADGVTTYTIAELVTYFDADPANRAGTYYALFTATLKPGDGSGSDVTVNVPASGYVLPSFAPAGFTAPAGKILYQWRLESTNTVYDMRDTVVLPADGETLTALYTTGGTYDDVEWRLLNSEEDLLIGNPGAEQTFTYRDSRNDASWPWLSYYYYIKTVQFWNTVHGNGNHDFMFYDCKNLLSADLSNFKTENVQSMSCMFDDDKKLNTLNLTGVNTSNVTNMDYMFGGCEALTSTALDLSGIDTSNVTDIHGMFSGCSGLTSLDLSGFDTSKVTDMDFLLLGCSNLSSLTLGTWETSQVTDMYKLFSGCSYLTSLDLSGWDVKNVTSMQEMFYDCSGLTSLKLDGWNTTSLQNMSSTFANCTGLDTLDLSSFDTSNVTTMHYLFEGCTQLENLDISSFDTAKVESMGDMFYGCVSLKELDLSTFNTSNVFNMDDMFKDCSGLTSLILTGWDTSNVYYMNSMFYGCSSLTELDASSFDTSGADDMAYMFSDCSSLKKLDISSFDFSNAIGAYGVGDMLAGATSLQELSLGPKCKLGGLGFTSTYSYWSSDGVTGYAPADLITYFDGDPTNRAGTYYAAYGLTLKSGAGTGSDVDAFVPAAGYVLPSFAPAGFTAPAGQILYQWRLESTSTVYDMCETLPLTTDGEVLTALYTPGGTYDDVEWRIIGGTKLSLGNPGAEQTYAFAATRSQADWPWFSIYNNAITSIDFLNTVNGNGSHESMFYQCRNATSADMHLFNTDNVTSMKSLFATCRSLESAHLNLSGWNTGNVTDMSFMFSYCEMLTTLDLTGFDVGNVTTMSGMFQECLKLESADLTDWDVSNVTDMSSLFFDCEKLPTLDLSSWCASGTGSLEETFDMFALCGALTSLNLSGWDTSNVTNLGDPFESCTALTTLNLHGWNLSNATDLNGLFNGLTTLTTLDVGDWNTSGVADLSSLFENLTNLTTLDVRGWNTSGATKMDNMFSACRSLASLDLSSWDTDEVTMMYGMFYHCESLTSLDLSHFDTSKVTNMATMFTGCYDLNSLNLSGWDTPQVTTMEAMFQFCPNLTSLDLSGWDTAKVTNMQNMFADCSGLTSLKMNGWDTSQVTDISHMFYDCSSLTTLDVSSLDTSNVEYAQSVFENCTSLEALDLSTFNTSKMEDVRSMFQNCSSLTSLKLTGWDTRYFGIMYSMFQDCSSLTELDVSSFNTSSAVWIDYLFSGCSSLKKLDISSFDLGNAASVGSMLAGLTSLQELKLGTKWGTYNLADLGFASTETWTADMATGYTDAELIAYFDGDHASRAGTYYAAHTVTIKPGEGSGADVVGFAPKTIDYVLPDVPASFGVPVGKEFTGWDLGAVGDSKTITSPVTITAQWEYQTFKVKFIDEDGTTVLETQTVTYGDTPVYGGPALTKASTAKYSYAHSGWSPAIVAATAATSYTATYAATAHVWGAPTWTWGKNNTSAKAKFTCVDCGYTRTLSASVSESKVKPTCTVDGSKTYTATVTLGGVDYTDTRVEAIEALGHKYPDWSNDATSHWKVCTRCGHVRGTAAHVSSGPATETTAEKCTVCGYVINPPLRHQHVNHLTYVAAKDPTCTEEGNTAYYKCSCGKYFADKAASQEIVNRRSVRIPALGHDFAEAWTSDASGHWHVCNRCGQNSAVEHHVSSGNPTVEHTEVCTTCGYTINPVRIVISSAEFADTGETVIQNLAFQKTKDDEDDWTTILPEEKPSKKGNYFEWWECSQGGEKYKPGDSVSFTYTDVQDVTFTAVWTQVIDEGTYSLEEGTRYRFGEGVYMVAGDITKYKGEQYVYPPSSEDYTFKQGNAS